MDPIDEFEFKPITEGLGFHRKTNQMKPTLDVSETLKPTTAPLPPPTIKSTSVNRPSPFQAPAKPQSKIPSREPATGHRHQPASSIFKTGGAMGSLDILETPIAENKSQKISQVVKESLEEKTGTQKEVLVAASFPALIFDSIVIVSLACLFVVATLLIANVDPLVVATMATRDDMTLLSVLALFASVIQIYYLISRGFYGSSLGEWAFDLEVGTRNQQASILYPIQVIFRTLINTLTGFILLPILSLLIGRDIAGAVSGIRLYQRES